MAIIFIHVPIEITSGKVRNSARCTVEVDTEQHTGTASELSKTIRSLFAKHLREMADTVEAEGFHALQHGEYDMDWDSLPPNQTND